MFVFDLVIGNYFPCDRVYHGCFNLSGIYICYRQNSYR